jgi:hypothetical protein
MDARTLIITGAGFLALLAPAAHAAESGAQPARHVQFVVLGDGAGAGTRDVVRRTKVKMHRKADLPPFGPHHFQLLRNSF